VPVYILAVEFHSGELAKLAERGLRNVDQSQCSLIIEHQSATGIDNSLN